MKEMLIVEAALFSAGAPMAVQDLADRTALTKAQVNKGLLALQEEYANRVTALALVRAGAKYALAVRPDLTEAVRTLAPPELPPRALRTLALVAYHQPILQSELKIMLGQRCYEHIGLLVEAGLVHRAQDGQSYRLTTTPRFPEYFGLAGTDIDEIRTALAARLGIHQQAAGVLPESDGSHEASAEDASPAVPVA